MSCSSPRGTIESVQLDLRITGNSNATKPGFKAGAIDSFLSAASHPCRNRSCSRPACEGHPNHEIRCNRGRARRAHRRYKRQDDRPKAGLDGSRRPSLYLCTAGNSSSANELIVAAWHDRGCPIGLTHMGSSSNGSGFKAPSNMVPNYRDQHDDKLSLPERT
jgi:hypothetical protein